jgi:hypothetical protein
MAILNTELTVDFGPIASDAPEDTPVSFTVRNEGTGESWSEGEFRRPLAEKALADIRWYLEGYWRWCRNCCGLIRRCWAAFYYETMSCQPHS